MVVAYFGLVILITGTVGYWRGRRDELRKLQLRELNVAGYERLFRCSARRETRDAA